MTPVNYSRAAPGDGVEHPENIEPIEYKMAGKIISVGVKWGGNGYEKKTCWIKCNRSGLVAVEE